jgi:hypothetical protein
MSRIAISTSQARCHDGLLHFRAAMFSTDKNHVNKRHQASQHDRVSLIAGMNVDAQEGSQAFDKDGACGS